MYHEGVCWIWPWLLILCQTLIVYHKGIQGNVEGESTCSNFIRSHLRLVYRYVFYSVSARTFYLRAKVAPEDLFRGQFFRKGAKRTIQRHTWRSQWSRVCNALTQSDIWKFSNVRESIQQSKRMDWLLYVECFRGNDLSLWLSRRT